MKNKEEIEILKERAADFIIEFEGFKSEVYTCPGGEKTFGYGTLLRNHPDVNLPLNESTARVYLLNHLNGILKALDESVKVPLTDNQIIALTSFIYNLGEANFKSSTLLGKLNKGKFGEAADELLRWIYSGDQILKGLQLRRAKEKALFLNKIFVV